MTGDVIYGTGTDPFVGGGASSTHSLEAQAETKAVIRILGYNNTSRTPPH